MAGKKHSNRTDKKASRKQESHNKTNDWRNIRNGTFHDLVCGTWAVNFWSSVVFLCVSPFITAHFMNGKKGIIVAFGIGITLLVWIIIITALRRIDENPDVKTTEKPTEPTKPEPEPKNMSEPSNITNIISNNQSGGITAHTVNMGPEKRSLSLQQREALLITLKTKPKGKVSVCWVESDLEATAFAQEISKLLRDAGNDVTTLPHAWITGSDGVGLSFKIRDDESLVKYADPILGSFKAAGIEARGEKSSEFRGDMLQITVGAKPLD